LKSDIHVFIIEDDVTMVGLLKTLLAMEGYQVTTHSQKGAIPITDVLATAKPNLVLLDVNLRDMDGVEILQQIKADPRLKDVKVIMSSGADYKDVCLGFGADRFLMKPYMPDDLLKMIAQVSAIL
jgi:DNA-binding response OmpR family regulator